MTKREFLTELKKLRVYKPCVYRTRRSKNTYGWIRFQRILMEKNAWACPIEGVASNLETEGDTPFVQADNLGLSKRLQDLIVSAADGDVQNDATRKMRTDILEALGLTG